MKRTNDGIRIYTERLQPQIRLFYRAAHVITGNRRLAERVLSDAILNAYLNRNDWRERMSFREGVMKAILDEGREQLRREPDADWDWAGLSRETTEEERPVWKILASEPQETQRTMILRYGCSLSAKEIASLTGQAAERVREQLSRFQARTERSLRGKAEDYKPFERYAAREIRAWMNRESNEPIDIGYFLNGFEKDAMGTYQPRRIAGRIVRGLFAGIGALIMAAAVWLIAVLMEA